jgi:putative MATE family efflux protein
MSATTKTITDEHFNKMTKWPIPKLVITLGIPTTISMLVTNIYNMADTFFVSELGNSASGAVGVVFGLMAIIQAFGFMFGHGAGSIIARKLGERDVHSAGVFATLSITACLTVGTLIGILGIIFIEPLMKLLGSTDTILPYAKGYGVYILISAPVTMTSFALNNILRYEGKAFFAMIGLTIGGVLNIICDPIFIFGFKMGIAGAGLATAISQFIGFCILLSMFLKGKTQSKLKISFLNENPQGIFLIMATGFPSLCRQGLNSIATMILNNLAGVYGDAAVAAMSIVNRISFFIFAVGLGIGQGFQPVASFNYGAKLYSRVKKAFKFTLGAGEVLLGVSALLCIIFSGSLIGIFRDDPTVIEIGTTALRFQLVALFFHPLVICSNMLFQSIGENKKATFLSMLRSGILFIPAILILTYFFGLFGIQIAQSVADVVAFFITAPLVIKFLRKLPQDEGEDTNG